MAGKYPNQAFTTFIPSASAAQFSNPQQYEGKTVAVSGKITVYRGSRKLLSQMFRRLLSSDAFGCVNRERPTLAALGRIQRVVNILAILPLFTAHFPLWRQK
jgi:hypothetical protein